MKLKQILLVILGALAFCSCSKNLEMTIEIDNLQGNFAIPIEDALNSLENFMIDRGMVMTKGEVTDYIDNYFIVSTPATKASCTTENVLYAVNFKDEGGYALLAADARIQEDIIAVTDQGCITEGDFNESILERIPTDNDDLSESEFGAMIESGVLADENINKQINKKCFEYARHIVDDGFFGEVSSGTWKTVKEVQRMINTAWTQSTLSNDIFNKYCPEVGLIWKRKAPAGCVCIALSQIIAFHEYPNNFTCNGTKIIYPDIKKIYYYYNNDVYGSGDEKSRDMLAKFCINIGACCNTKYHSIFGNPYGFAWPSDAKSCLEKLGYKNVSLNWKYNESEVIESLDNGCPVFMSSIAKVFAGHAWVID